MHEVLEFDTWGINNNNLDQDRNNMISKCFFLSPRSSLFGRYGEENMIILLD